MLNEQRADGFGASRGFDNLATYVWRQLHKRRFRWLSGLLKMGIRMFYDLISGLDRNDQVVFLNYGYISFDPNYPRLILSPEDEDRRCQIQLYHHVASAVAWSGLQALEVGSGRGGGAAFLKQHFQPAALTCVDFSAEAVAFCNRFHASLEGLRFMQGDAEALQFPDESFDIVINVESSLYYPNAERFFMHVTRILKPNGHFLYADLRYSEDVEDWQRQLRDTGLELLIEEDITQNVRVALSRNQEYHRMLAEKYVPGFLRTFVLRFGGSEGARLAQDTPANGQRVYKRFVFRKSRYDNG